MSEDTLKAWAHLSLKQRAKFFHRQYPELKVSSSSIQRLYKKHNIRFKLIQRVKKVIDYSNPEYRSWFMRILDQLKRCKEEGMRVVFLDEAVFTFNTFRLKAWSSAYSCIKVNDFAVRVKTQALLAAVTLEEGMFEYAIHPKSIKAEEFQVFLRQLSGRFEGKPFAIFMDNLSVHKTNVSKELFTSLGIMPIFNIPYSPQFNGIESYFSLLKNEYKNLILS